MKERTIKALMVEPNKHPVETELTNDLDSLQKAVSIGAKTQGLIEILHLENDIFLLCNEEGKLQQLKGNRKVGNDIIAGVFYICKSNEDGDFCSLTEDELEHYKKRFWDIEYHSPAEVQNSVYMHIYFG